MKQTRKLLGLFGDDPTVEQVQNILGNGDLFKQLLETDLTKVDRELFAAALRPPVPQPSYTPVADYVDRIMARNELRDWGFTAKHADALRQQLEGLDHAGPLAPVGVRIWRGRDLAYNWAESIAWLQDEVKAQGLEYYKYFDSVPTFSPGSEIKGKHSLTAVGLDFSLWDPKDGLVPNEVRPQQPCWPSLEVPDLLCLNPQLIHIMDGENFPFLMATGLVVVSDDVPNFSRCERGFYVFYYWADDAWYPAAMVRSRELQH